ncbi:hypothetical protein Tco_0428792 [Tanacetum coccineum]
MKQNGVSNDALRLSLFPYSLTIMLIAWYDRLPRNSIHSFDDMMRKFLSKYFPPSMQLENEDLIEYLFYTTTESPEVVRQLEMMNKNFVEMMRQIQTIKSVDTKCETCGGPHSFTECPTVDGYTQEAAYATTANTTRSGVAYDGPTIPPTPSPLLKEVERETEMTKDKVQNTSLGSTAHVQPSIVQDPITEPEVAPKPKPKPLIPYPSRLNDQKLREKANNQMFESFILIFKITLLILLRICSSTYADFASTFKSLLSNK